MNYEFKEGCLWDENPWYIQERRLDSHYHQACKHCTWEDERYFTCIAVIADNEGGHNSTGVCLQCILEAAKSIEQPKEEKANGEEATHRG